MSADDCDSARQAAMGLCFELFILRQEVVGKKPDLAALRCWWERAESEGIAAYRTVEPWLDPLAATREGLCREGSLFGSSAADVILRLWTRGRLIAGEALEAAGEKGNLVWRCLEAPNPGDVELDDEEAGSTLIPGPRERRRPNVGRHGGVGPRIDRGCPSGRTMRPAGKKARGVG
jgi:hypothetical protein